MRRLEQFPQAGANSIHITEPLPSAYEIQNKYNWGDAINTPYWLQTYTDFNMDMYNGYAEWLQKVSWLNDRIGELSLETLGGMVVSN
ncbi:Hypothetical predicted protein [Lecanosticta acicola]|uniref:Uncharacterized protein n=1 Tax=Lecanosticta acicola TaxID=111012 RepID=A0AAI8Z5Y0_9PEZI|nr:Hypothetical predicted protein [Lecanosticta acicola]